MSELDADIAQLNQHPNLAALIALLVTIIEQQTQRIAQLESELAQLRAQVNQNSQNSHKPPSSEGYRKAPAIPMNEATIQAANRCTASALVPSQAAIEAHLAQAAVAHADETGLRCAGRLHWLHVLSTPRLSTYFVHPKRGHLALESSSLLARFSGCLVHDCWGSYFVVHPGAHGLCNAHLIRELRALSEQGAAWAGALIEVFLEGHRYKAGQGVVPAGVYRGLKQRSFGLLRQGLRAHPMPVQQSGRGRRKRGKARSLIRRLIRYHAAVWRFAHDEAVPFTNNQAERTPVHVNRNAS